MRTRAATLLPTWLVQEKKPTTQQLFGWLSSRFDLPLRVEAFLLFPWRFFTTQLRKLRGLLLGRRGTDPPPALETS